MGKADTEQKGSYIFQICFHLKKKHLAAVVQFLVKSFDIKVKGKF